MIKNEQEAVKPLASVAVDVTLCGESLIEKKAPETWVDVIVGAPALSEATGPSQVATAPAAPNTASLVIFQIRIHCALQTA